MQFYPTQVSIIWPKMAKKVKNQWFFAVFEKSTNLQCSLIFMSRVPFWSQDTDGHFEWFPDPNEPIFWAPEHFFCKIIDYFPRSVAVFEKSANWWPPQILMRKVSSERPGLQLSKEWLEVTVGLKISSPELF